MKAPRLRPHTARLAVPAAAVFASFATLFGPFPVLTPFSEALGASAAGAAAVVSIYSVTNLPGNLVAGILVSRWGPHAVLRVGLWLTALTVGLYAAARSAPELMLVRALHGFAAAWIVPAAFALAATWLPAEQRGQGMGRMGAPIGLAAVLLPPLAGVLSARWGPRRAFLCLAGLVALAALVVELAGPRPEPAKGPASASAGARGSARTLLGERRLWPSWLAGFALPFNLGFLAWYLPVAASGLGMNDAAAAGAALGLMALTAATVMFGPGGRWSDAAGRRRAPLLAGLVLLGVGLLIGLWPGRVAFFAAALVFGVGFGLIFPAANALIADLSAPAARGLAFALFYAWFSVGTAVGPPVLAWWQRVTGQSPFLGGAVVALLAALAAGVASRPPRGTPS